VTRDGRALATVAEEADITPQTSMVASLSAPILNNGSVEQEHHEEAMIKK